MSNHPWMSKGLPWTFRRQWLDQSNAVISYNTFTVYVSSRSPTWTADYVNPGYQRVCLSDLTYNDMPDGLPWNTRGDATRVANQIRPVLSVAPGEESQPPPPHPQPTLFPAPLCSTFSSPSSSSCSSSSCSSSLRSLSTSYSALIF